MKNLIILSVLLLIIISCAPKPAEIDEKLFKNIWQAYVTSEFEESFYEKLSSTQKEQIIFTIAGKAQLSPETIKIFMQQKHPEKYKRVYLEN